ncbi:unnamed protein product [Ectocarpus sp. CCAP 1310/34]|nr:unnamed protein product [Ectocarpus sp. CCAP 1310/34]
MSSKVGMEDFTATRPSAVIVLDLESEADVLARVSGRRVDMATGKNTTISTSKRTIPMFTKSTSKGKGEIYHQEFRPPPAGDFGDEDGGVTVDALPGDGIPGAVTARLESYRRKCDDVVRSFASTEGGRGGGGAARADGEQKQGQYGDGGAGGGDGVFQWDAGASTALTG